VDPGRAAAILTERLRETHTLEAFRSVIRVPRVEVASGASTIAPTPRGADGLAGDDGQDGEDGEDGEDGVDGVNGVNVSIRAVKQAQTAPIERTSDAPLPP